MLSLPHNLHLFWLGSVPPNNNEYPYRRRILQWQELNPLWDITLWTNLEDTELAQLQQWCDGVGIELASVWDIEFGSERTVVLQSLHRRFWATAVDLLRLRVLYQFGGMYVDFDVEPREIPEFHLPLGIGLLMQVEGGELISVFSHVLVSHPEHNLLQIALWQGQQNCEILSQHPIDDFRSHANPNIRYGATLALTGDIYRPALASVGGLLSSNLADNYRIHDIPLLQMLQITDTFIHYEDTMWLQDALDTEIEYFYPEELIGLIQQRVFWQIQNPLTSVLHWASVFADVDLIQQIAQKIEPFEDYFGFSPKHLAQRYHRSPQVLQVVPDM